MVLCLNILHLAVFTQILPETVPKWKQPYVLLNQPYDRDKGQMENKTVFSALMDGGILNDISKILYTLLYFE